MTSIAISASMQIVCGSSNHVTNRKQPQQVGVLSLVTEQAIAQVVILNVEGLRG